MKIFNQNLDFVASMNEESSNVEAVSPDTTVQLVAGGCAGSLGTLGSAGGCLGTFGSFGCYGEA